MSSTIPNAKDIPLNQQAGTVPQMSGALTDWFQPMVFGRVTKRTVANQVVETKVPVNFRGVIQPLSERKLMLKPEGERAWTWLQLHSDVGLELNVDEIITYHGVQTRVMALNDYSLYGYMEYHLVQDWTGSGPSV